MCPIYAGAVIVGMVLVIVHTRGLVRLLRT